MKIYLASSYDFMEEMQEFSKKLIALGHEVTARWVYGLEEGMSSAEAAQMDFDDIDSADALVLFPNQGTRTTPGKNIEFGYALAKGKQVYLIGEKCSVFHDLPQVLSFPTEEQFLLCNGI